MRLLLQGNVWQQGLWPEGEVWWGHEEADQGDDDNYDDNDDDMHGNDDDDAQVMVDNILGHGLDVPLSGLREATR